MSSTASSLTAPTSRVTTRPTTKPLNWVPAALLRSPLHRVLSGKIVLFEYVGRRSGQRYATPINYHEVGLFKTLLVSTDSPWYKNFTGTADPSATVVLRGKAGSVRVEVVADPEEAADALVTIVRAQPAYGRWTNIRIGADGQPDRADAEAEIGRGRRVLRLHLQDAAAA